MRKDILTRLALLEAKLGKGNANQVKSKAERFHNALMATVAFHAGKYSIGESFATAFARGLGITTMDLKKALASADNRTLLFGPNNRDSVDIWALTLEKLNALVVSRGGRPIAKNGKLVLEWPDDDRRDGFEVLDELFQEIPDDFRKRFQLLPSLSYYFKEATSGGVDDPTPSEVSPGD